MPIQFSPTKIHIFPFLILFKRIESIDMTPCVVSFLVKHVMIAATLIMIQSRITS